MDNRFLLTAFSITSLLLFGCKGEQGPTGPPGRDGNANVAIVSFTFSASSFSIVNNDSRVYIYSRSTPELTSSVVNGGAVLLYMRSVSIWWQALPQNEPTWPISITYGFAPSSLTIAIRTNAGDAKNKLIQFFGGDTDYQGRLILIPSNSSFSKKIAILKNLNYDDLKKELSLSE